MVRIDRFDEFSRDILYIFDLDDTLLVTPRFEDIAKKYLVENVGVKELLNRAINQLGVDISDLKMLDGRIYVDDSEMTLEPKGDWVRKGKRVYLTQPDKFSYLDESLPVAVKELTKLYKSVENKCIVTARPESMRPQIEKVLKRFDLEIPKFGLHMCPDGKINAGLWKGQKIVEIINETGFQKAIFYDDNSKYIRGAKKVVSEKLPDLDFKTVKVL